MSRERQIQRVTELHERRADVKKLVREAAARQSVALDVGQPATASSLPLELTATPPFTPTLDIVELSPALPITVQGVVETTQAGTAQEKAGLGANATLGAGHKSL